MFIKVTEDNNDAHVNRIAIGAIIKYRKMNGRDGTALLILGKNTLWVKETPEEIDKLIVKATMTVELRT